MKSIINRWIYVFLVLVIGIIVIAPFRSYAGQVTRTLAPTMVSIRGANGELVAESSKDQKYVHPHNGNTGAYVRGIAYLERGKKYTLEAVLTNYSYGGGANFDERVISMQIYEDFKMAPEYFRNVVPLYPVGSVNNAGILKPQSTDGKTSGGISVDSYAREHNIATPEDAKYRSYIYTGMGFRTTEFEINDLLPDTGILNIVVPAEYTYSGDNLTMPDDYIYMEYRVVESSKESASKRDAHQIEKEKKAGIGTWEKDSNGWWYRYSDGSWPAGKWLELDVNGTKEKFYFGADGYVLTGWNELDGKKYYFCTEKDGKAGVMLKDTMTPDGNYVNKNGEWEPTIACEYMYVDAIASGVDPLSPELDYSGVYGRWKGSTERLSTTSTLTISRNSDGTYQIICSGQNGYDVKCRLIKRVEGSYAFVDDNGKEYVFFGSKVDCFCAYEGPYIYIYERYD